MALDTSSNSVNPAAAGPFRRSVEIAIFEYVEVFYDRRRRNSTLVNSSPAHYEAHHGSVA